MIENLSRISPALSFFVGLFLLPLLSVSIFFWQVSLLLDGKEFLELLLSASVPAGILIAFLTYFYNKSKDQKLEIGEQIAFMRTVVIPKQDEFILIIKKFNLSAVHHNFNECKLELILEDDISVKNLFKKQYPVVIKEYSVREISVTILNMLEEFSFRVLHNRMLNNASLNIVHTVFVNAVESHFLTMLYLREIEYNRPVFKNTLIVYFAWKNEIERGTVDSRIVGGWKHVTQ